jgi:hypothetical protein
MAPDSIWKWLHRLGGPGLILLGLADNAPFVSAPAGSVALFVILLSAHRHGWWAYYAFMAAVGEVFGGYLTYRLAQKGGHDTLERKVGKPRAETIYKQFEKQVNQILQKTLLDRLIAYQHEGNKILGVYNDKRNPTEVARQFEYMLSYSTVLPRYLPDLYNYLLSYPRGKPENVEDSF